MMDGSHDDASDAELLRRTTRGDETAFRRLVERYIRPSTLLAAQLLGDRDDAEDAVQRSFIVALERASTFDEALPFAPWLFGIVRRIARQHKDRATRRRRLWRAWRPDDEPRTPPISAQIEAREELERVSRLSVELPAMQRACFELVVVRGLSPAEVAAMHGISESTVRQHVFRARRTIANSRGHS